MYIKHHTSNEVFQMLRFEQVQENDTRKTKKTSISNVAV
jgi:hypothetical protein